MPKAERSDKGTVKVTERDLRAFEWLADMKAAFEDDLAVLLGRWAGRRSSADALRQTVNRWRRAHWATAQQLRLGRPRVVRLLPGGAQLLGHEMAYNEPAVWTSLHAAMVSHVRLWLEAGAPGEPQLARWSGVAEWESERRIRARLSADLGPKHTVHVPDGIVTTGNGTQVAVELERTEKNPTRLDRIVAELTDPLAGYPATLYVTDRPGIARHVEAAFVRVSEKNPGRKQLLAVSYPKELKE